MLYRPSMSHLGIAFLAAFLAANPPSEFDKFPPEPGLSGQPKAPQLVSPMARRYRTMIRDAAAEGPNFNGRYTITQWGCGTNCILWAVINHATGEVWASPKPVSSCWVSLATEDEAKTPEWIVARRDSSLIYVHECVRPESGRVFDTRHVYVWKGSAPQWLRDDRLEP